MRLAKSEVYEQSCVGLFILRQIISGSSREDWEKSLLCLDPDENCVRASSSGDAELSYLIDVSWCEEGTHRSCLAPRSWGRTQQLRMCWDSAAASQVGHSGAAELVVWSPALCSCPADC